MQTTSSTQTNASIGISHLRVSMGSTGIVATDSAKTDRMMSSTGIVETTNAKTDRMMSSTGIVETTSAKTDQMTSTVGLALRQEAGTEGVAIVVTDQPCRWTGAILTSLHFTFTLFC